jgi:hypothetical protein
MNNFAVYGKGQELVITPDKFSYLALILGPLIFIVKGQWRNLVIFFAVFFVIALFVELKIISFSLYFIIYLFFHIYLAIDYSNIYERFLFSQGFMFKTKIISHSAMEAEAIYKSK